MMYFDTVLAMGQRNAAMACTRATNAVIYIHESAGYRGTNYLDDLIGVSNPLISDDAYAHLGGTLAELGLLENFEKACAPATKQIVLGVEIDTVNGTCAVPADKLKEIIDLVRFWLRKRRTTKVQLQSLIGHLQFITKCVLQSRVFLNRLLETLRNMSKKKSIKLSEEFKLHFKALVTTRRHLSDKIFISSQFIANLKTCHGNMAYMLYFQKILGFTSIGRLEMQL